MVRTIAYTLPAAILGLLAFAYLFGNLVAGLVIGGLLGALIASIANSRAVGGKTFSKLSVALLFLFIIAITSFVVYGLPISINLGSDVDDAVVDAGKVGRLTAVENALIRYYGTFGQYPPDPLALANEGGLALEDVVDLSYAYPIDQQQYHIGIELSPAVSGSLLGKDDDFNSENRGWIKGFSGTDPVFDYRGGVEDELPVSLPPPDIAGDPDGADKMVSYRSDHYGFSFQYPANLSLRETWADYGGYNKYQGQLYNEIILLESIGYQGVDGGHKVTIEGPITLRDNEDWEVVVKEMFNWIEFTQATIDGKVVLETVGNVAAEEYPERYSKTIYFPYVSGTKIASFTVSTDLVNKIAHEELLETIISSVSLY